MSDRTCVKGASCLCVTEEGPCLSHGHVWRPGGGKGVGLWTWKFAFPGLPEAEGRACTHRQGVNRVRRAWKQGMTGQLAKVCSCGVHRLTPGMSHVETYEGRCWLDKTRNVDVA